MGGCGGKLGEPFDDLLQPDTVSACGGNRIDSQGKRFDLGICEFLTDSLNHRYRATLALVAFLMLLNQLLVQPSLMRLTTDAPAINIAGRQRMLSQRLAKSALALESKDSTTRRRYLDELDQVLRLWIASHDGLRHGNRACRCRAETVKPSMPRSTDWRRLSRECGLRRTD